MKTEIERICEIMETLLAHQPIIDVPYEQINDIAVALVQEGYGNIRQAQIDILNELKKKTAYSFIFGQSFLTERVIDKMIEELKK